MSFNPRALALQGFLLTPIAMAVQGLLKAAQPAPAEIQFRPGVVAQGPGTTIGLSDYLKKIKHGNALISNVKHKPHDKKAQIRVMRRREEEVIALAELFV